MTFLTQEENDVGAPSSRGKPKPKHSKIHWSPANILLHGLKQSSKSKAHSLLCVCPASALAVGVQSGSQNQSPSFPTSSLDKGGRSPSEVHVHPQARPSLNQHIINSIPPSPSHTPLPENTLPLMSRAKKGTSRFHPKKLATAALS